MTTFTDRQIRALQPRPSSYYLRESTQRRGDGRLVVKVQPSGSRVFYFQYHMEGKRRFLLLGTYPALSLAEARELATEAARLVRAGINPRAQREAERQAREAAEAEARRLRDAASRRGSLADLLDGYIAYLKTKGRKTWVQVRRAFDAEVLPTINGDTKARDVTPDEIRLVLYKVIQRGGRVYADRLRSYLHAAFQFGLHHDNDPANMQTAKLFGLTGNPVAAIPVQNASQPRDRELSPAELRRFWSDLSGAGFDKLTETALKLCLATGGQRPSEILGMAWGEIDAERRVWELPAEKTKNGKAHVVPLNDLALSLIRDLVPITGDGALLFPSMREPSRPRTISGISRAVARYVSGAHITDPAARVQWQWEHFTARDLRRTCKTRMGELGISKETRDRIHNHAAQDVSARHYDRYDYLPEKRRALELWGQWLTQTIDPADNVVTFRGHAQ